MKKRILSVLLVMVFVISAFTCTVAAASTEYSEVDNESIPVKVGKHYYKLGGDEGTDLRRSSKKSSGYKRIIKGELKKGIYNSYFTNDSTIFAQKSDYKAKKFSIVRFNSKGKKPKTVFKLPKTKSNVVQNMAFVNGKYILVNRDNTKTKKQSIYRFNRKTKKFTKISGTKSILDSSGNYIAVYDEWCGNKEYVKQSLYKITSSGKLKKIKTLGSKVSWCSTEFAGKKLYYAVKNGDEITLYRCNRNGSNKEALGSFSFASFYYFYSFKDNYCKLGTDDGDYNYYYKSGRLVENYSY